MKKGTMTIVGVIMVGIMLIVFAYFLPVITNALDYINNNVSGVDDATKSIVNLAPMVIALAIIMALFVTARTPSEEYY